MSEDFSTSEYHAPIVSVRCSIRIEAPIANNGFYVIF